MSVTVELDRELDVGRGDLLVHPNNQPRVSAKIDAMLVWMGEETLDRNKRYLIKQTTKSGRVKISEIKYRVDVATLSRQDSADLNLNEIGRVSLHAQQDFFWDPYTKNRQTGSFVLVNPETYHTVAAGMILDRVPTKSLKSSLEGEDRNVVPEEGYVSHAQREELLQQRGVTVWFTGLSGAGKSTLAKRLDHLLVDRGFKSFPLDGDNLRSGLNSDLGFSREDRDENLRRAAEVAKLFNQSGMVVTAAFITPRENQREMLRNVLGAESLIEVFVDTPIEECKSRDVKGLYAKALKGEIKDFTGVSAPFERPIHPDYIYKFGEDNLDQACEELLEMIQSKLQIKKDV
jgi:bifunctional enzyme CysN/CysC